ncbi:MAG TPA: DegT/DnrJ/EryC1/StrS family aminotransferase [Anaerolineales bacterium]
MKAIRLVDLQRQYEPMKGEILSAISSVLDGMNLFLGENVYHLERDFARFCQAKHAVGVGSGTDGLYLALRACGVGPGDEVITAPNTFFATVEAIVMVGATPVFVDIEPGTYTIDPSQIEAAITPRTKALLPVHLYGHPANMRPIIALARRHGLRIIEDACQAHGAEHNGHRTGSLGNAAVFSFYYSKNLGAYGEGGMIVTSDRDIATKLQMLRNHGSPERYRHTLIGVNSRLDEIQAAILRLKLDYLEQWNMKRRSLAIEYSRRLSEISDVVLPTEQNSSRHVFHLFVIQVPRRDQVQQWLSRHGIETGIHYPVPIHLQEACTYLGYKRGAFPRAEAAADHILSLPMHPDLTIDDVAYVCQTLKDCIYGGRTRRAGSLPAGSIGEVRA